MGFNTEMSVNHVGKGTALAKGDKEEGGNFYGGIFVFNMVDRGEAYEKL